MTAEWPASGGGGAPAAHQSTHVPNGSDALPWLSSIHGSGLESAIPSASSSNAGLLYLATDTQVCYQSTGAAWTIYAWDSNWTRILNGGNNNIQEAYPRMFGQALGAYVSTGVMYHIALPLRAGTTVTNLTSYTSTVSASGITHWWFALYDTQATPALLQQSADQLTAAIPTSSKITLALASPVTITVSGVYYACAMVAATTPTSWITRNSGIGALALGVTGQLRQQGTSGSGLLGVAPATIASPAGATFAPLMVAT